MQLSHVLSLLIICPLATLVGCDLFRFDPEELERGHFLSKVIQKRKLQIEAAAAAVEPEFAQKVPGIIVKLTDKIERIFVADSMRKMITNELQGSSFETIKFKALQMNVSVFDPEMTRLQLPEIDVSTKEPHSLLIKTTGGFAKFKGLYKGVYRTVRDGYAHTIIEGLNLHVELKVLRTSPDAVTVKSKSCEFTPDSVNVEMKPALFSQANQAFVDIFQNLVQQKICDGVEKYAAHLGRLLMKGFENGPVELETVDENSHFNGQFVAEPVAHSDGLVFGLNGLFEGEISAEVEGLVQKRPAIHQTDSDFMVYTYYSDDVFNSYLNQFKGKEMDVDIPKKMAHLMALDCGHAESCLGNALPHLNGVVEGHVKAGVSVAFKSAPRIQFHDNGASLELHLTTDLFLQDSEDKTKLGSADFTVKAFVEKFEIQAPLDSDKTSSNDVGDDYKLRASIKIEDIDLISTSVEDKKLIQFAEDFDQYLQTHKDVVKDLLEHNLHYLFPLRTNSFFNVESIHGFFRENTLVFAFDIAADDSAALVDRLSLV